MPLADRNTFPVLSSFTRREVLGLVATAAACAAVPGSMAQAKPTGLGARGTF